jgi:hypothetical protein
VEAWAQASAAKWPQVVRVGYFGSYARGNWGVGSDVDLVVIVREDPRPFWERAGDFDATGLPVPADVFVYTEKEWAELAGQPGFGRTAAAEVIWVYCRPEKLPAGA